MFNYARLYAPSSVVQRRVATYAACMHYIVGGRESGDLPAVRANLNLQSLTFRTIDNALFPRYMLAQDQMGYQVFVNNMASSQDFLGKWNALIAGGIQGAPASGIQTFNLIADAATNLWTDLKTVVTTNTNLFFSGHGMGSGVAALAAHRARGENYREGQVYQHGAPKLFTPASVEAMVNPRFGCFLGKDITIGCPPSRLWDTRFWFPNAPPMIELAFLPGRSIVLENDQSPHQALHAAISAAGDVNTWPTIALNVLVDSPRMRFWSRYVAPQAYVEALWESLPAAETQIVEELSTIMANYDVALAVQSL